MASILLATDFKPESKDATAFAMELATYFSAKLAVAYVVDLSVATRAEAAVITPQPEESRRTSAEAMESLLQQLGQAGIVSHGQILEAHNSGAAIVGLAQQLHADAIVMGTEARHGLKRFVLGSRAEDVIRHALCPVFTVGPKVVKTAIGPLGVKNIIFATDLKHDVLEKAAAALGFAKSNSAKIHLFHVLGHEGNSFEGTMEMQLKAEEALRKLIPEPAFRWGCPRCVVEFGDAGNQILELAKNVDADLIVLGAQRSTTWFPHMVQGVVDHVLAESPCPVMTVCVS